MDVRVSRSEPTDKSWELCDDHAPQEEMEPYPLYNRAKARHTLETKTNLVIPNTRTNHQMLWSNSPDIHGIPTPGIPPNPRQYPWQEMYLVVHYACD